MTQFKHRGLSTKSLKDVAEKCGTALGNAEIATVLEETTSDVSISARAPR